MALLIYVHGSRVPRAASENIANIFQKCQKMVDILPEVKYNYCKKQRHGRCGELPVVGAENPECAAVDFVGRKYKAGIGIGLVGA